MKNRKGSGKKVIKNAIAYVTRKKNRTFIIFVVLTILLSCLNRTEDHKVVNKILIFSSSPESTNSALNKIKGLKIDWSKYTIEKDTTAFEETLESVSGIKHIIRIMTYSIMLSGIVVALPI